MQAAYMDKYEERIKEAMEKAEYIASIDQHKIPSYEYIGVGDAGYEKRHLYYSESEDKYYYESFFAREMRLKIRNNRFKNYTKK